MFKKISSLVRKKNQPDVITFTGGMGAQIISAAIYFQKKIEGKPAYADLKYFDQKPTLAKEGKKGEISHWDWQLEIFGLRPEEFNSNPDFNNRNSNYLFDGVDKLELGLNALSIKEVKDYFKLPAEPVGTLLNWLQSEFLCVHIRRGDYINVASHLVSNENFLDLIEKFRNLIQNIVVISDSPIEEEFQSKISHMYKRAEFLDKTNANTAHCIMRLAKVLICSNSQFSLAAAALNNKALVMIPSRWYGFSERHLEMPLHARCGFQIFDNIS